VREESNAGGERRCILAFGWGGGGGGKVMSAKEEWGYEVWEK